MIGPLRWLAPSLEYQAAVAALLGGHAVGMNAVPAAAQAQDVATG